MDNVDIEGSFDELRDLMSANGFLYSGIKIPQFIKILPLYHGDLSSKNSGLHCI